MSVSSNLPDYNPVYQGVMREIRGIASLSQENFEAKIPDVAAHVNILFLNFNDKLSPEDLLSLSIVQQKLRRASSVNKKISKKAIGEIQAIRRVLQVDVPNEAPLYKRTPQNAPALSSDWFKEIQAKAYAEQLMKKFPGPDHIAEDGMTALIAASISGDVKIVTELLEKGANVNLSTKHGETPLMQAAEYGNTEVLRLLLKCGADVHASTKSGFTPLVYAAIKGQIKEFHILLKAGANPSQMTIKGSVLNYLKATRPPHWKLMRLLVKVQFSQELVELSKQVQYTKLVTHAFSLKGNCVIQGQKIPFEGGQSQIAAATMAKSVASFATRLQMDKSSVAQFVQSLEYAQDQASHSSTQTVKRIAKGEPTCILTGYQGHAATVFIWKGLFILCDRSGSRESLSIHRFDPSKLNENSIELLINKDKYTEAEYNTLINETLPKALAFTQTENEKTLQQLASLPPQIVGNCSWASTEGVVKVFMLLEKLGKKSVMAPNVPSEQKALQEAVNANFAKWQVYQQMQLLEKCIKHTVDPKLLIQSFNALWAIRTTFSQSFDVELQQRLKELETSYKKNKSPADQRRFRVCKALALALPNRKPLQHLQAVLGTLAFIFSSKKIKNETA